MDTLEMLHTLRREREQREAAEAQNRRQPTNVVTAMNAAGPSRQDADRRPAVHAAPRAGSAAVPLPATYQPATGNAIAITPQQPRSAPPAAPSTPWPAALADFALLLTADDLPPCPFAFGPASRVADRGRFLTALQADVRAGADGPRGRLGGVQADLVRLRAMLIGAAQNQSLE